MAKQMKVEISSPKGLNGEWLYASLDLPAEEHEIRDAYHRARVMSHEDERYLSVYDCEAFPMLSFVRVETEGIDELNFLAQRLDSLEEHERNVLLAITPRIIKNVGEGDVVSAKDLINLTYGLDKVTVAPYVKSVTELGELAIQSELYPWMESVPDEGLPYLDRALIKIFSKIMLDKQRTVCYYLFVAKDSRLTSGRKSSRGALIKMIVLRVFLSFGRKTLFYFGGDISCPTQRFLKARRPSSKP